MGLEELNRLKDRLLHKSKDGDGLSEAESVVMLARELKCLPEIIGRTYEVRDAKGTLVYTIRQKPMALKQLNNLSKVVQKLKEREKKEGHRPQKRRGRR